MDSEDGQEYWENESSWSIRQANHDIIHKRVAEAVWVLRQLWY